MDKYSTKTILLKAGGTEFVDLLPYLRVNQVTAIAKDINGDIVPNPTSDITVALKPVGGVPTTSTTKTGVIGASFLETFTVASDTLEATVNTLGSGVDVIEVTVYQTEL